jgi:hypothetical protein
VFFFPFFILERLGWQLGLYIFQQYILSFTPLILLILLPSIYIFLRPSYFKGSLPHILFQHYHIVIMFVILWVANTWYDKCYHDYKISYQYLTLYYNMSLSYHVQQTDPNVNCGWSWSSNQAIDFLHKKVLNLNKIFSFFLVT